VRTQEPPHVAGIGPCLLWLGARKANGYGVVGRGREQGNAYVHRVVWEEAHGPIPSGPEVCHRCDVRHCAEVSHLFLGDSLANARDMVAKGRSTRGTRHALARLTEEDVLEIRRLWALGGQTLSELARQFATTKGNVSQIVRGKRWTFLLPDDWSPPPPRRWSSVR
jgi:hypothetical protein